MPAIVFPPSPTSGQFFSSGGLRWRRNATLGTWDVVTVGSWSSPINRYGENAPVDGVTDADFLGQLYITTADGNEAVYVCTRVDPSTRWRLATFLGADGTSNLLFNGSAILYNGSPILYNG